MDKTFRVGKWSILVSYLLVALFLYFPVLDKGFVSDDFTVLFRLIYTKDFTPPGFFRPGADLSLYSTYLLSGLNVAAFNISNLVIHVLNAWLLFLVCRQFHFLGSEKTTLLPVIASFIFLIYPFHQEPIVWVLGRGILLSSFFALLSVLVLSCKNKFNLVTGIAALFYFLSLLCYESSVFLPVVVFLILKKRGVENQKLYRAIVFFSIAFLLHLVIRDYFSGSIIGAYGKDFNAFNPGHFAYEYLKFWLRFVMVPVSNLYLFLSGALVLLAILIYAGFKLSIRGKQFKHLVSGLVLIISLSFLVPSFFGITVRTTEGDRFLYFPSIFFSFFLALVFTYNKKVFPYLMSWYTLASIILIFANNQGWKKSSEKVESIIGAIKRNSEYKVIIYNLPGSKNGKYIFRNGFKEALLLNNIDSSGIYINNLVEDGIPGMDRIEVPLIIKNNRGVFQTQKKAPFNLVPPYCIINITTQKVQVFQVGYSISR